LTLKKWFKISLDLFLLIALVLAPLYLSAYNLSLLGRFLAMAILSLGLCLVWGWGGILSLGQGVFWGLGAYVLAMHLKLVGLAPGDMPDFMMWSGLDHIPRWWTVFRHPSLAFAGVILVPTVAAAGLAWLVFNRRVSGVYFALITQALALAFATLLISQQAYTGGFNGLTDFGTLLGHTIVDPVFQRDMYWVTLVALVAAFLFCQWISLTNFGKVLLAIRDGENRIRFLGYNPATYKTFAFAIGGTFAGVSGALYILHVGVISPAMVGVVPSIEMVVAVAVGGRASFTGVVLGTLLVNFGKDWISSAMPDLWQFAMGLLFVLVVTILPQGLAGIPELRVSVPQRFRKRTMQKIVDQPNQPNQSTEPGAL
jgi:urea transport system permease protein